MNYDQLMQELMQRRMTGKDFGPAPPSGMPITNAPITLGEPSWQGRAKGMDGHYAAALQALMGGMGGSGGGMGDGGLLGGRGGMGMSPNVQSMFPGMGQEPFQPNANVQSMFPGMGQAKPMPMPGMQTEPSKGFNPIMRFRRGG